MTDDSLAVSSSPSTLLIRHDMVFASTPICFYFFVFWMEKAVVAGHSLCHSSAPQSSQASTHPKTSKRKSHISGNFPGCHGLQACDAAPSSLQQCGGGRRGSCRDVQGHRSWWCVGAQRRTKIPSVHFVSSSPPFSVCLRIIPHSTSC